MTTIVIRPTEGGRFGPLDGPFSLFAEPTEETIPVIETLIVFARHVGSGISFYNNKTGFADSSLFKSFAAECFAELESDDPQSANLLSGLTIDCREIDDAIRADKSWQLHKAILATLPGIRFCE